MTALALRNAFSRSSAEFLETTDTGLNFMDYGIPLGHRFRSLKLWFVLRYYGREGLRSKSPLATSAMAHQLRDRIGCH